MKLFHLDAFIIHGDDSSGLGVAASDVVLRFYHQPVVLYSEFMFLEAMHMMGHSLS